MKFLIRLLYQLFDVLIRIADHKCHGSLPIHVRLWADEFYAGPKPNNTKVLMGTIRSRNLSIVPILQSIAQIKAVFPQEKWEVFLDNCAVMIYLGSGPAAFSTHEYISKLLGEMTIDTRTDGVTSGVHGNSSLNNQRAGRGLMTSGEVKKLDRKKCLIFMEGQYPIMDWKNLPFNTAVWKESERLAGKEGYKHPVRVEYNPKTMTYRTILNKSKFQVIDKKDLEFYKEAEKTDKSIKVCEVNEEDFLYLNFDTNPKPSEEELMQMLEKAREEIQGLEKAGKTNVPNFSTQNQETNTAKEENCIIKPVRNPEREKPKWEDTITNRMLHWSYTPEQKEEVKKALAAGVPKATILTYFYPEVTVERMSSYRKKQ